MIKLSEEDVRRFVEIARDAGLEVDEEALRSVAEGETPAFYLGYLSGITCAVNICRQLISTLGARIQKDSLDGGAEKFAAESLVIEAIGLITMRTAAPAAVAAEQYLRARGEEC